MSQYPYADVKRGIGDSRGQEDQEGAYLTNVKMWLKGGVKDDEESPGIVARHRVKYEGINHFRTPISQLSADDATTMNQL